MKTRTFGFFLREKKKEPNFAMKLALGLDVQTNAKGGKFMSIEDSRQGAGAARTELESQLQRAVKVSAKGKHVKCKMDLERCLFWDPAGNRAPRPAEFVRRRGRALVEARHVWLMAKQRGVLFEVRHLMLEPLEAPCCPFPAREAPTYRWRSVRWQDSRSRRTRLWRVSPWQLA